MLTYQLVNHLKDYATIDVIGPWSADGRKENEVRVLRPNNDGLIQYFAYAIIAGASSLRKRSYDVIIAGSALVIPVAYSLRRIFKVPLVVNVHGLDIIYANLVYQWIVKIYLRKCDLIVANSQASKEEAIKRGVFPEKLKVIHPGVAFSEFEKNPVSNIKIELGLESRPVILTVGRLARRKGILEFLRNSLPKIVGIFPNLVYIVVGGNPDQSLAHREDMRMHISQEVERLGLEKNVLLLGRVNRDELIALYHACDIFIFTGIHIQGDMEGFGIVLIEAGAAGKPVVAMRVGGVADAVNDGNSGILIDEGAWDVLADKIIELLSNRDLRDALGAYGKKRVKSKFDWPIIAHQYLQSLFAIGPESSEF